MDHHTEQHCFCDTGVRKGTQNSTLGTCVRGKLCKSLLASPRVSTTAQVSLWKPSVGNHTENTRRTTDNNHNVHTPQQTREHQHKRKGSKRTKVGRQVLNKPLQCYATEAKKKKKKSEVDSANASGTQALDTPRVIEPGVLRLGVVYRKKRNVKKMNLSLSAAQAP